LYVCVILDFLRGSRMTDTVTDWIAHHAITTPGKTATIDLASDRRHDYAQMNERVGRIAGFLRGAGVKKGDRVGLIALNSSDVLDIIFATWRIGAVHLALNFRLTATELTFIVGDAAPKLVIADIAFSEVVDVLKAETPDVRWVSTDGLGGDTEFEKGIAGAEHIAEMVPLSPAEQAMLMYSSGTTGRPKGVVLTHGNMLAAVINEAINFEADRNTVSYAVMPLFHIGAMMGFSVPAMFFGATAVIERVFEPGAMLEAISCEEFGVTHFLGLPAVYNALAMHPNYKEADFSRIVIAAGGAEPMPEPLLRSWHEHGVPIVEVYGMTEVCGLACSLLREDVPDKIGSAGKAAMFIDMKIMKSDMEEAAPGEQGEIWMRGANVTPGYWQRPEANETSFSGDWLKSGDIGRKDERGYIYIDDRIKDMYISGGENVYPAEVENILYLMPQISEVAVVGVPDPKWGETGCAVVVLKEGQELDLESLQRHCEQHLARYKHPQRLVIQAELPRNATGKVLKFQIREDLA
jgi:fatty-acyl-CoA synthase